jgi:hypothetical protein
MRGTQRENNRTPEPVDDNCGNSDQKGIWDSKRKQRINFGLEEKINERNSGTQREKRNEL